MSSLASSEPGPQGSARSPVPASKAPPPGTPARSLAFGAACLLLMAVPFLVFGLVYLDLKALVSLECPPGGPCTLARAGWLSSEVVGTFPLEELQGAHLQRSRSPRGQRDPVFRPMLDTARGTFPLNYDWLKQEQDAARMVEALRRFRESPAQGLSLSRDDRHKLVRTGVSFSAVGALLAVLGTWVSLRALRQRARERAAAPLSPPA